MAEATSMCINLPYSLTKFSIQILSLISSLCVVAAFVLSWLAAAQCNFLDLSLTDGDSTAPEVVTLGFGFFNHQAWTQIPSLSGSVIFDGCSKYPEYVEIDSYWKAARAFIVMTLVFGMGMMISELFGTFRKNARRISPITGGGFLLCSIFAGLSLLLLQSDLCKDNVLLDELESAFPNSNLSVSTCKISTGAKCAISATILWFLAGVASLKAFSVGCDDDKCPDGEETS